MLDEEVLSLFMERFAALSFFLPPIFDQNSRSEKAVFSDLSEVEILYIYGLGRGASYLDLKEWLREDCKRKLIFLEQDMQEMAAFLKEPFAKEFLRDEQVFLEKISVGRHMLQEIEVLCNKWPVSKVEILSLPSKRGRRFQSIREKILRKTTLSHAIYIDRMYGFQPFSNFLQNVKRLKNSFYANGLRNAFQGTPAILCGAGPSLDREVKELKKGASEALLIAGGSAIAALSSRGITPHFGVAVDPNLEEYRRFQNSFAFEMPLLYSTRLFPKVFQTLNGPFGYMRSAVGGILELWLEEELGLQDPLVGEKLSDDAISVTTMALGFALLLGCSPIIFCGVDLAYTDGKIYAEGIVKNRTLDLKGLKREKKAASRIVKRKGNCGEEVWTVTRWLMESLSFSDMAKKYPKTAFYNTSAKGLAIPGVKFLSLREALSRFGRPRDYEQQVMESIFASSMPKNTEERVDQCMSDLKESLKRVVEHLEILCKEKKGSTHLAEEDLREELAYSYLFYDTERFLEVETKKEEKWRAFLRFAKKHLEEMQNFF